MEPPLRTRVQITDKRCLKVILSKKIDVTLRPFRQESLSARKINFMMGCVSQMSTSLCDPLRVFFEWVIFHVFSGVGLCAFINAL
jgi:hypothetical protein